LIKSGDKDLHCDKSFQFQINAILLKFLIIKNVMKNWITFPQKY